MVKYQYMAKNEIITIVVTCYNVEEYVVKCFDSILRQTYTNIEIIAVDDHSSDDTKKIIQRYEKKYKNFKAIYNKRNRGQGYSRNIGIAATNTKYISFVDSDDWIEINFIEELYKSLISAKADIALCDIYVKHDNPSANHRVVMYDAKPNKFGFINTGLAASSCNKLYKTEIFKGLNYPENLANDDIQVVLAIMYKYNVTYTDKTYYNYYQRIGSTQNGHVSKKRLDVFKSLEFLKYNIGAKIDSKTWDAIIWHQVIVVLLIVIPRAKGLKNRRELIKEFHRLANDHGINLAGNQGFANYTKQNRLNYIYGNIVVYLVVHRLYLLASLSMKLFNMYLQHTNKIKFAIKVLRLPITFAKDPIGLINRVRSIILRKNVIKTKTTIRSLISEAKKQQKLRDSDLVSVVIPNYNYKNFLIERVYSILFQTKKIGEIIILDDKSTDQSIELAEEIKRNIDKYVPVRLINNKTNQGTFNQWKKGFYEAKYDYVWIAEADDFSHKDFLNHAVNPLINNHNVVLSYVDTGFIDEKGIFIESARRHIDYQKSGHWNSSYISNGLDEIHNYSFLNNTIANVSSVVFRKLNSIDYEMIFKDSCSYKQAGDWVFYLNYMQAGDISYVNKTYNYYRFHGNNVSANTKAKIHLDEILRIYNMLDDRLKLTKKQKQMQQKRIKYLKKAWKI
jgi:glycosyltransferase involved in cell wall biosynthesis